MYPVLFHFLGYPVPAYGFFLAVAHLAAVLAILGLARARHLPIEPLVDLLFVVILSGLFGARLGYAATHWSEFSGQPLTLLSLSKPGLAFYSGFLFAFFPFLLFLRWKRLPVLEISDLLSPVLPLFLGILRLGCLGAGCCYGSPTSLPWGLRFQAASQVPPALQGQALHPTQAYEALALFLLGGALFWLGRRGSFRPGVLATFSIFSYAAYRFLSGFLRADEDRGLLGLSWLTLSQLAAAAAILSTPLVLWICLRSDRGNGLLRE